MANPIDLTGSLQGCQLRDTSRIQNLMQTRGRKKKQPEEEENHLAFSQELRETRLETVCARVSAARIRVTGKSRRRRWRRKGSTLGALTNPDGKEGKSREGRLEGRRAKGPGQFNGPFVYTVRPPALTGRHTHKETHKHTPSLSVSLFPLPPPLPPPSIFHCFAL